MKHFRSPNETQRSQRGDPSKTATRSSRAKRSGAAEAQRGSKRMRSPLARPGHSTLSEARSRLDRSRFSRPNTHFAAFFKIYKKTIFSRANLAKFCQKIRNFCKFLSEICRICLREDDFLVDLEKCCKMRIWTRKSALIQPRTSPGKSDGVVAERRPQRSVMRRWKLRVDQGCVYAPCECAREGVRH